MNDEWQYRSLTKSSGVNMIEQQFNHPCKDTCSGWKQGFERGQNSNDEKTNAILKVCQGNEQYMWSAKIISIILDCDFRDAKQELEKRNGVLNDTKN